MDSNIAMEILSFCPIKDVDRFKSVSKEWNKLLHEPYFIRLHTRRTKTVSGYFVQGLLSCKYISTFVPIDISDDSSNTISLDFFHASDTQILATSNMGIMCVVRGDSRTRKYYICKPSTKQYRALPNPRIRHTTAKVALTVLSSKPLHYKIVRLSDPRSGSCMKKNGCYVNVYRCEVFDSDTWAWKRKEDVILPYCSFLQNPVLASGKIYWKTTEDCVLEFDEILESHQVFQLPKITCEKEYSDKKLTKYEGKIAFISETREDFYEIWVSDNLIWEKKFTMDMKKIVKKEPFRRPQSFSSIDVALINGGLYNNMFDKFPNKTDMEKYPCSRDVKEEFLFKSDFEQVEFKDKSFQD